MLCHIFVGIERYLSQQYANSPAKVQKKSHIRKDQWDFFDLEGMITAFFGHEQIWAY